ncbi:hypothetical protein CC1G_05522 [Coprinopsis cinerea okayama7|uniref:Derlin n=1 Tax=Coprinopsis cinerea (strain Okayama-7 / 130 / ATCC MYA-4618 / FGSC 9003) TaxID=240176 RepID=A8P5L3_COPC7|nr:hypothetical protein CC1G_05522 [Coprinopsis cinerea okayama7\|eukprot:XP_001838969.1 hypothetical protein CC1G_05522 [Coprinopsis cinerea okayama7\
MDQIVAELKKIPPVTRFMTVSTVSLTVPVLMQLLSPYRLLFVPQLVLKHFELWRLYTSYFLGTPSINFIFEMVMLYRSSDQLESGPYAGRSSDYAWQLFLAAGTILLATRPIQSYAFLHPLLACLAYVSANMAPPGSQTSLMGLVTLPVIYQPYIMVLMDLLMAGPRAAAESVAGIIVGHGWWWSMWGGGRLGDEGPLAQYGRAPSWLVSWFGERRRPRTSGGGVRTDTSGAAAALRASGIEVVPPRNLRESSPSGHSWGHGQRLGS